MIATGVMLALAAIPGLPKFSFLLLAHAPACWPGALPKRTAESALQRRQPNKKPAKESIEDLLKLDELSLEVGYGLVPLVDQQQGGQLLARVKAPSPEPGAAAGLYRSPGPHHRQRATEAARIHHRAEGSGNRAVGDVSGPSDGDQFGRLATAAAGHSDAKSRPSALGRCGFRAALQNQALASGYAVVDQTSVLATHLAEVVKQHAHELLTRQEVKRLLDRLAESHPKLVEELVPKVLSLGEAQKVLQQLLREQVSIRDLPAILETLLDVAPATKNAVTLVESVRQSLGRALVRPLLSETGGLRVVTLDNALEEELGRAFTAPPPGASASALQPPFARRILEGLRRLAGEQVTVASPVVLCSTPARYHLKRLLEPFLPKLVVLSPLEVPPVVEVQSMGVLR